MNRQCGPTLGRQRGLEQLGARAGRTGEPTPTAGAGGGQRGSVVAPEVGRDGAEARAGQRSATAATVWVRSGALCPRRFPL